MGALSYCEVVMFKTIGAIGSVMYNGAKHLVTLSEGALVLSEMTADMEFQKELQGIYKDVLPFCKEGEAPISALKRLRAENSALRAEYLSK